MKSVIIAMLAFCLSGVASAGDRWTGIEICNKSSIPLDIAVAVAEVLVFDSSNAWTRNGWGNLDPGKCTYADTANVGSGEDMVVLITAITKEGGIAYPGNTRAGGVQYCVSDDSFKLRGGGRSGMSSCPEGQYLLPFPYYEMFRWQDYRQQFQPMPRYDIVVASVKAAPNTQAESVPEKGLPSADDMAYRSKNGPHFVCTPIEIRTAAFKGDKQVERVGNLDCQNGKFSAFSYCKTKRYKASLFLANSPTEFEFNGTDMSINIDKATLNYRQTAMLPSHDKSYTWFDSAMFWISGTCRFVK